MDGNVEFTGVCFSLVLMMGYLCMCVLIYAWVRNERNFNAVLYFLESEREADAAPPGVWIA